MKLYMMIMTTQGREGLLISEEDRDAKWWSLKPDASAEIVKSLDECELYNTLYAVEYDTDKMKMHKLLKIMHKKLSKKEVKTICENDAWLNDKYSDYLRNPFKDKKNLKKLEKEVEDAKDTAILASVFSIFN